MPDKRILVPGRNCWRIRRADRVAFIVDGADYFRALHESLPQARRQIMILSWDIYSRLRLIPDDGAGPAPPPLSGLLNRVVAGHKRLHAYVLNWDFAMLFALAREWVPIYSFDWKTHHRLRFCMDDRHPVGGSHHQKVVVIDDALAFAGGLDLTRGRWDTSEHRPRDPRRATVDGTTGRPYHDSMMAVTGAAAAALGDLARERWRRASGTRLDPPKPRNKAPWPTGITPDLENVPVAIVRTEPPLDDHAEVREVEQLYLDAIAAAKRYIYIENQYFTSSAVGEALAQRMSESSGLELIINLPLATEGWLAQQSMDVMRVRLIEKLRKIADPERFVVYYPYQPGTGDQPINLHAKIMVVDDRLVRIGSANLNNRSMGLDTECDLAVEAAGNDHQRIAAAIARFRNRLLAEHLDTTPQKVEDAVDRKKSLIQAVESLRGEGRTLRPLEPELPAYEDDVMTDQKLVDPERPVDPERLLDRFVPPEQMPPAGRRVLGWVLVLLAFVALAAAWRYTPLSDWLNIANLTTTVAQWRDYALTPLLVVAAFVVGGMLVIPLTIMIIVTVLVFDPLLGFAYSLAGSVASALLSYALGAYLGRETVRRLAGRRINKISRQLGRRGLLMVILVRVVPVAPFTVVNMVAGASHIRFRDFALGTVLGMSPGMLAVVLLADRVAASVRTPSWETVVTLVVVAVLVVTGGFFLSRQLLRRTKQAIKPSVGQTDS